MQRLKKIGMPLFTLLLVLAVWEGCVRIFAIDLYILPAPSKIVQVLFANREVLWMHSLITLQEAVAGLLIATLLAVVIAIGMDVSQIFKHSIFPHLVVTQTVPVMVLGPLFSIWLGFGMAPKILMVIFMCFFPVVIAFCDALGKVDEASDQSAEKLWCQKMADLCICENTGSLYCIIFRLEGGCDLLHRRGDRRRVAECLGRSWILYDTCEKRLYAG